MVPIAFNNTEPSKTLRAELIEKCMQAWKGYSVENIAKYMYGSWSVQCYQEPIREDSSLMGSWYYTMRFTYTHTVLVLLQCYTRHLYPWTSCQIRQFAGAHAPGMPGTFPPPPQVSEPYMHHGTCETHVPWCMPGSLISGFLWSRRRGKTFPAFPAHAQAAIWRIWQEAHSSITLLVPE